MSTFEEREHIREAVENGEMTIEEAAAAWPFDDQAKAIVQSAAKTIRRR